MTAMTPLKPELSLAEDIVVRLLRRWSGARAARSPILPALIRVADDIGASAEVAVSLASVFEITEALLERRLETANTDHAGLSHDEEGMLMLLIAAPAVGPVRTQRSVPHGLPGVLAWAARSARVALHRHGFDLPDQSKLAVLAACPFDQDKQGLAAVAS